MKRKEILECVALGAALLIGMFLICFTGYIFD